MRTLVNINNNQQPLRKCGEGFYNLLFLRYLQLVPGQFTRVRKKTLLKLTLAHVLVLKGVHAGRDVLQALVLAATANRRIYLGLGLMGVAAPLSACFYLVFDRTVIDESWYHLNYFHLFFLLSPHICMVGFLAGIFYLFPYGSKRSYLVSIPTGWTIGKMIWLVSVQNNEQFWQPLPMSVFLMGVLISFVLYLTHDWLTWRQFHRVDSFKAREKGLFQIADDIDPDKFRSMWKQYYSEKVKFQKEY